MKKANTNVPLIKQRYLYIGESNSSHINGETYYVVETGYHWIKEYGFVVWMTNEEYGDTTDVDYCTSMSMSYFKTNFWKH